MRVATTTGEDGVQWAMSLRRAAADWMSVNCSMGMSPVGVRQYGFGTMKHEAGSWFDRRSANGYVATSLCRVLVILSKHNLGARRAHDGSINDARFELIFYCH